MKIVLSFLFLIFLNISHGLNLDQETRPVGPLDEMGPGDVQSSAESIFFKSCIEATEILKIKTKPSSWSKTKKGQRACYEESSLNLKKPCYVVKSSNCFKGKCQQLSQGFDLRNVGVDLTRYSYTGGPIYLTRKNEKEKLSAIITQWEISEAEIRSRCK